MIVWQKNADQDYTVSFWSKCYYFFLVMVEFSSHRMDISEILFTQFILDIFILWYKWFIMITGSSLYPNISMHILHTVLYTFPKLLTRRVYLKIESFCSCWSFPSFSWPQCLIQGWCCKKKLEIGHSLELKGFNLVLTLRDSFYACSGKFRLFLRVIRELWMLWLLLFFLCLIIQELQELL